LSLAADGLADASATALSAGTRRATFVKDRGKGKKPGVQARARFERTKRFTTDSYLGLYEAVDVKPMHEGVKPLVTGAIRIA
jgi:Na+/alanine symporter